jgi:hypothetical protein
MEHLTVDYEGQAQQVPQIAPQGKTGRSSAQLCATLIY